MPLCRRRLVTALALVTVTVTAWAGCTDEGPHEDPAAPAGCDAASVERVVRSAFAALSSGDGAGTAAAFAPKPAFQWLSVGALGSPGSRQGDEATDRDSIPDYVARRHAQSERAVIEDFTYNGYREVDNVANFQFRVRRQAADLGSPPVSDGKGAVDCATGRIIVLSYS